MDDGGDVVELHAEPLGAQVDDLQAGGLGVLALPVGVAGAVPLVGLGPEEVLDELEGAAGAHVLGEVRAPGLQHTGDLRPVGTHGVPAHDEVEGVVREGQRRALGRGHDGDAARAEQGGGLGDVRRPDLGRDGEHGCLRGGAESEAQDLPSPGVDVERGGRTTQPPGHRLRVSPGGPGLGGPPLEPGEVPALGGDGGAFGDEVFEGACLLLLGHEVIVAGRCRWALLISRH
ncbi:hypothetical protein CLM62_34480 [Streptomyces sp. SA15]|nr:hypothetical protein CLM62_34480 [Streptomyces sp. SA15]